jgi:hypothetical protein
MSEVFGLSRWFAEWVSVVAIGPLREFSDQHGDRDLPEGTEETVSPLVTEPEDDVSLLMSATFGEGTGSFLPFASHSLMIRSYSRRDSELP